MARLVSNSMTLSDAKLVLNYVVETQISHPGKGVCTQGIVMVSDIQKVISAVTNVSRSHNIQPEQYATAQQLVAFIGTTYRVTPCMTELDTPAITQNPPPPATLSPACVQRFSVKIPTPTPSLDVRQVDKCATGASVPISKDVATRVSDQFPSPSEACAQSPMQVVSPGMQEDQSSRHANTESCSQPNVLLPSPSVSNLGTGLSPSVTPTPIPHWQTPPVPGHYDSQPAGPSGSTGQSTGFSSCPPAPPPLMGPMMESAALRLNSPALTSQGQLLSRKRSHVEFTSGHSAIQQPYFFKLPDGWVDTTPVQSAICREGFYTSTDVPQFVKGGCPAAILNELSIYQHSASQSDDA
ncbi:hypothetical protein L873DRAFT_1923815 [Choiromyces venosus 120613-1]|uniref:Uncharacterized protein n=1 Tax=Choiromyces venosus 120613-1 TaxID=1336337 RepID=A0A3N4IQL7_9PEZI|nr:hypothetical protein L873DRAFT_1923815 [Choiromyces venosus 120613-1]